MAASGTIPLPAELFDGRTWLLDRPDEAWRDFQGQLARYTEHAYRATFCKQMAIVFVYASNKLEGTLPSGASERETYCILGEEWAAACGSGSDGPPTSLAESLAVEGEVWFAEGGNRGESAAKTRIQMRQHLRALLYLTTRLGERWTPDTVREAHQILMSGAVEQDGSPMRGGEWRTTPAFAGTHPFPHLDAPGMQGSTAKIMANFDEAVHSSNAAVRLVKAPADLLYEVVTLHPFTNGNGRLCRLLFAAAAMKAGVPFPSIFAASYGKAAKRRYLQALEHSRKPKESCRKFLYMVALATLSGVMANFATNVEAAEGFPSRPVVAEGASGGAGAA